MKRVIIGLAAISILLAPNASADTDTDFSAQMQTVGIYGQKDYNAWLAKITCKRLTTGVDADGREAAEFLHGNLDANTEQVWQFLGAGLRAYCPEHLGKLS
ncbi:DUF732 domain-containing protein [Mycobacterium sp. 236(2023)]|uniref:DUF732 domain-containing protein n=1 Tax=Mycobacterium sp. 236(2023) TaxID=3038163 RepID=UPI0024153A6B|nr:DUF732 domain-containing protein [Mycobacterium sp. 236(2023)]MDG4663675.1 DUF732 domain-containing protein [Mycobacterium sp. 236(2023)]